MVSVSDYGNRGTGWHPRWAPSDYGNRGTGWRPSRAPIIHCFVAVVYFSNIMLNYFIKVTWNYINNKKFTP